MCESPGESGGANRLFQAIIAMICAVLLWSCAAQGANAMEMRLSSPTIRHGEPIPEKHSCDGEDVSPALAWEGVPEDAKSLALVVDDPDAPLGTWDHWIVFNIPPGVKGLKEGAGKGHLPSQALHGRNSWKRNDWGGPCPPQGRHRYYFKLFALDAMLELSPGASKAELLEAMDSHILARAELMGTYER